MKIYPIYFEENGVQQILELCLTRRLAEKECNLLNANRTNKKFYTYPTQVNIKESHCMGLGLRQKERWQNEFIISIYYLKHHQRSITDG